MQVALSKLASIHNNAGEVLSRVNTSIVEGRSCKLVAGRHRVCFFPCMRFNYCHADQSCCTDARRLPVSLTTLNELMSARVKVSAPAHCPSIGLAADADSRLLKKIRVLC